MDQATDPAKPRKRWKRPGRRKVRPRLSVGDRVRKAAAAAGSRFKGYEEAIARLRTEAASRVERAGIVLAYRSEPSSTAVGALIGVTHHTVQRYLRRAVRLDEGSTRRQSAAWQGPADHRRSQGLAGISGLSEGSQQLRARYQGILLLVRTSVERRRFRGAGVVPYTGDRPVPVLRGRAGIIDMAQRVGVIHRV
jgi:hypothetical protein